MHMIKSHQALLAMLEDSSEAQVLRDKLDNDFILMEDRLSRHIMCDERQYADEISIEEKTRMIFDRLDMVRTITEKE